MMNNDQLTDLKMTGINAAESLLGIAIDFARRTINNDPDTGEENYLDIINNIKYIGNDKAIYFNGNLVRLSDIKSMNSTANSVNIKLTDGDVLTCRVNKPKELVKAIMREM